MRRRITLTLAALACLIAAWPDRAAAQPLSIKDGIVGAWHFVSVVSERDDGSTSEPFGANPKGIIIFTADGYFSLFQSRAEVPKLAANDRARATPEEAQAVLAAAIAYYGRYTVDEAAWTIAVRIEGSTFGNMLGGPAQTRIITALSAEELMFTNPRTPSGMTLRTTWRRARPA